MDLLLHSNSSMFGHMTTPSLSVKKVWVSLILLITPLILPGVPAQCPVSIIFQGVETVGTKMDCHTNTKLPGSKTEWMQLSSGPGFTLFLQLFYQNCMLFCSLVKVVILGEFWPEKRYLLSQGYSLLAEYLPRMYKSHQIFPLSNHPSCIQLT